MFLFFILKDPVGCVWGGYFEVRFTLYNLTILKQEAKSEFLLDILVKNVYENQVVILMRDRSGAKFTGIRNNFWYHNEPAVTGSNMTDP